MGLLRPSWGTWRVGPGPANYCGAHHVATQPGPQLYPQVGKGRDTGPFLAAERLSGELLSPGNATTGACGWLLRHCGKSRPLLVHTGNRLPHRRRGRVLEPSHHPSLAQRTDFCGLGDPHPPYWTTAIRTEGGDFTLTLLAARSCDRCHGPHVPGMAFCSSIFDPCWPGSNAHGPGDVNEAGGLGVCRPSGKCRAHVRSGGGSGRSAPAGVAMGICRRWVARSSDILKIA